MEFILRDVVCGILLHKQRFNRNLLLRVTTYTWEADLRSFARSEIDVAVTESSGTAKTYMYTK